MGNRRPKDAERNAYAPWRSSQTTSRPRRTTPRQARSTKPHFAGLVVSSVCLVSPCLLTCVVCFVFFAGLSVGVVVSSVSFVSPSLLTCLVCLVFFTGLSVVA